MTPGAFSIPEDIALAIARLAVWKATTLRGEAHARASAAAPNPTVPEVDAAHLELVESVAMLEDAIAEVLELPTPHRFVGVLTARPLAQELVTKALDEAARCEGGALARVGHH